MSELLGQASGRWKGMMYRDISDQGGREVATKHSSETEERENRYFACIFKIVMNLTKFWGSD